jgi:hypothetical protein
MRRLSILGLFAFLSGSLAWGDAPPRPSASQNAAGALGASNSSDPVDPDLMVGINSMTGTILASLKIEKDHVLHFMEFQPGLTGTVEVMKAGHEGQTVVTRELSELDIVAQYRVFAGASARIPEKLLRANERQYSLATERQMCPQKPANMMPAEVGSPGRGDGPHFYNQNDQSWFKTTQCPGAFECIQGWDWAQSQSQWAVRWTRGIGLVGSEAKQNGHMWSSSWKCYACCEWYCPGSALWTWIVWFDATMKPGWTCGATATVPDQYIYWMADSIDSNATTSLAVWYY